MPYRDILLNSLPWHETPVWRSLDIGDGWLPIIENLSAVLNAVSPGYKVAQVKEKFGGLRFYADGLNDAGSAAVRIAEAQAGVTCEVCGGVGRLKRRRYFYSTRCDAEACTVDERGTFVDLDAEVDDEDDD